MRSAVVRQQADWLVEHGLKELELLFRAVLYHPSQPILIADSNRKYLDANSGAGRLLGLSRDQIIGARSMTLQSQVSGLRLTSFGGTFWSKESNRVRNPARHHSGRVALGLAASEGVHSHCVS